MVGDVAGTLYGAHWESYSASPSPSYDLVGSPLLLLEISTNALYESCRLTLGTLAHGRIYENSVGLNELLGHPPPFQLEPTSGFQSTLYIYGKSEARILRKDWRIRCTHPEGGLPSLGPLFPCDLPPSRFPLSLGHRRAGWGRSTLAAASRTSSMTGTWRWQRKRSGANLGLAPGPTPPGRSRTPCECCCKASGRTTSGRGSAGRPIASPRRSGKEPEVGAYFRISFS